LTSFFFACSLSYAAVGGSPSELKNSFVFFHAFEDFEAAEAVGSVDERCKLDRFVFVFVFDFDFDLWPKDGLYGSCHFFEEDISISEYCGAMNCDFIVSRGLFTQVGGAELIEINRQSVRPELDICVWRSALIFCLDRERQAAKQQSPKIPIYPNFICPK
jgi:hypothetical protein